MKRIAILISGSGTNMENLIRKNQAGVFPAQIVLVLSDNPAAKGIEKAKALGVKTAVVDRKSFPDKKGFEAAVIAELDQHGVEFIALAGFMRILSGDFVRRYEGRMVNVHPSFLPQFPGAHGIRDAFQAKVKETGVTIHWVTEGVDAGPVILQKKVPIHPHDTLETLEARIHAVEYDLYPEALRKVFEHL